VYETAFLEYLDVRGCAYVLVKDWVGAVAIRFLPYGQTSNTDSNA